MEKTKLDHETEDWLIAFLSGELDEWKKKMCVYGWRRVKRIGMLTNL